MSLPPPELGDTERSEDGLVRLVAPLGRDAAVLAETFRKADLRVAVHPTLSALRDAFEAEGGDVLVLTSEALDGTAPLLHDLLDAQPAWSDVPVLVLKAPDVSMPRILTHVNPLSARHSLTVLERPLQAASLLSFVRAGWRARQRQYEVRDLTRSLEHANATLEMRVEERTRQVRELASDLALAEQRERRRIAHLLHDNLQQVLFGLQFQLQFARSEMTKEPSAGVASNGEVAQHEAVSALDTSSILQYLQRAERLAGDAIDMARTLTVQLSPPVLSNDGLGVVFQWLANHMQELHGLEIEVQGDVEVRDKNLRVLLFQLGHELLFNVVKHAETKQARVELTAEEQGFRIDITDEGRGFEPSQLTEDEDEDGFGLHSVRERVHLMQGRFALQSSPGEGTHVSIVMPLKAHATEGDA